MRFIAFTNTRRVEIDADSAEKAEAEFMARFGVLPVAVYPIPSGEEDGR